MCLGHLNGVLSMVTPRDENNKPVVTMFCHNSPISNIAIEKSGKYLVTSAVDHSIKVWDIRKTYQPVLETKSDVAITSIDISHKGIVAMSTKNNVKVWGNVMDLNKESYMDIKLPFRSYSTNIHFCPYEDILGVGHSKGFTSAMIPGSGESLFDSKVPNPYSKNKNIASWNVATLLEKIPPDMINLDPTVVGTTGERQNDFHYDKNVQLDDGLKEKLNSLGIIQKVEKKKITSRDELTKVLEDQHQKIKENQIGKEWWNKKGTNALDRFASGKQMRKPSSEDEEDEEEEIKEETASNEQIQEENENLEEEKVEEEEEEVQVNEKSLYGNVSDSEEEKKKTLYDYETEDEDEEPEPKKKKY
jgi:U3 small nucleolar RNA-associated protein 7